jgi:hypothetical protein
MNQLESAVLSDAGRDQGSKPFGRNELLVKVRKILAEASPDVRLDATNFRLIRGARHSEPLTSHLQLTQKDPRHFSPFAIDFVRGERRKVPWIFLIGAHVVGALSNQRQRITAAVL